MEPENTTQAVRIGQWKAVRDRLDADIELHDLSKDLGETNNIAQANPTIIKEINRVFKNVRTDFRPQPEPRMPDGKKFRWILRRALLSI